jgi:2-keto-4-pentenoate hydratase/2-oxohepta-3-ene-1,7-dioic acid hydratase in catechol pathway
MSENVVSGIGTVRDGSGVEAVLVDEQRGVLRASRTLKGFAGDALDLLRLDVQEEVLRTVARGARDLEFEDPAEFTFVAPYRNPGKILGIGLNYREHAGDLDEKAPEEPASFIKGAHTIIGPGETILLPSQSERVTTEGELGIVIGRMAYEVDVEQALEHVWGFCSILDQTAEDILRRNPRFLTRCKNFPTFFAFGPLLVPRATVLERVGSFESIVVETVVNGDQIRRNTVGNMTHGLASLVSFHSYVMPLFPGDIISTGTPGAIQIHPGDTAVSRVSGVGTLEAPVRAGESGQGWPPQ